MPFTPASQVKPESTGFTTASDAIIAAQSKPQDTGILQTAKNAVGGFSQGVGGIGLTAIDYAGRKAVEALPDNFQVAGVTKQQMLSNLAAAPKLQDQVASQMGVDKNSTAYGVGNVAGQIATIVTPGAVVGKTVGEVVKLAGAGKTLAKVATGAGEGYAFDVANKLNEGGNSAADVVTPGVNTVLGGALPIAGAVVKATAAPLASKLNNSLIKPLLKNLTYGKNPGQTIAELGITGNSLEDLATNISKSKQQIGSQIGNTIAEKGNVVVDSLSSALKPIDEAIAKANKTPSVNASLIQRLQAVKDDLMSNINSDTVANAHELKSVIGDVTKWTKEGTDDELVNKTLKQVYGTVNGKIDSAISKTMTPEEFAAFKKANEQYGGLISAENATKYRDLIEKRQNIVSMPIKVGGVVGGATALATGGIGIPVVVAGIGAALADKALGSAAVKTRVAKYLMKLAPGEINTALSTVPGAKALFTADELSNFLKKVK